MSAADPDPDESTDPQAGLPDDPQVGPVADPSSVERIRERTAAVRRRIRELTDRDVRVVCVTKGHPLPVVAAVIAAGFDDLGENYAQELRDKASLLAATAAPVDRGDDPVPVPRWHFLGRLQSNKVRMVADVVTFWHSVDRVSLADHIARRAPGAQVLVQVDLAGLAGRGGCDPAEVPELVAACAERGLVVRGLMGVAPPGEPGDARPGFRLLDSMAADLGLPERSMGMSGDYEVAVEEGATIVRIGRLLLGPREPR